MNKKNGDAIYLQSSLYDCNSLEAGGKRTVASFVDIMRRMGLPLCYPDIRNPAIIPNPMELFGGDHYHGPSVLSAMLHPGWEPDFDSANDEDVVPWSGQSFCDVSLHLPYRFASFRQSSLSPDDTGSDAIANGLVAFTDFLFPHLQPQFAFVDAVGDGGPEYDDIDRTEASTLGWRAYFGPTYVERFGREFLLGMPAWKVDDFGAHGIAVTLTESWTKWVRKPPRDALAYFQQKSPRTKLYRRREGVTE